MKQVISQFVRLARKALAYLGDAAHRRFIAMLVAMLFTHLMGEALDEQRVAMFIEILVGGLAGAWSSTTPKIDEEGR